MLSHRWIIRFLIASCFLAGVVRTGSIRAEDGDYAVLKRPVRVNGPTVTKIGDDPVHLYGDLYVYSRSPDFQPGNPIQEGNAHPRTKITPKKPWEIESNYLGVPARIVEGGFNSRYSFASPHAEYELYWPVHLIDGDPESFWMIRRDGPYEQPFRTEPVELRIDLPQETTVRQINMITMPEGPPPRAFKIGSQEVDPEKMYYNSLPKDLEVLVSRDGHHWDTVFKTDDLPRAGKREKVEIPFLPRQAKQIMLRGNNFGPLIHPDLGPFMMGLFFGYTWAFAELEVLDNHDRNVALASRGAGITQYTGRVSTWDFDVMNDVALAMRYDLGAKWIRANYWGGNLMWHYVEQEPGVYVIDPVSDLAVSEAAKNGIDVIMGLEYGNWLYADSPRPNLANNYDPILFDPPPSPITPEQIEAYTRWVRFMVENFKDRITWWEIWNEPSTNRARYGFGSDREGARHYANLIKATVPVIRELAPDSKIMISNAYWPWEIFKEEVFADVAQLIDGFELHVRVYEWSLDGANYQNLPKYIRDNRAEAESMGFNGVYLSQENQWFAEPNPAQWMQGRIKPTYIGQAKNMARLMFQNAALEVVSFWQGGFQMESGTLAPSYYVFRTLATVTDGAKPAEVEVGFSTKRVIDHHGMRLPDGNLLLGLWLPGDAVDNHTGQKTEVTLPNLQANRITGIDTLNGTEQAVNFESEAGATVIRGLVVHDYPLVLRIEH